MQPVGAMPDSPCIGALLVELVPSGLKAVVPADSAEEVSPKCLRAD
ncbi:UNVERIFIED_ORG: hypothetical protein ABIC62_006098 [Burkholderia sp. 1595]|uniref:Uncharacterized protein n=1 Tax=Paraburkholderia terricola TaxID=169427 RepID=A0ABU1M1Q7_9BURK|nr:hypothetical protein [Paraburkholderia terricola]